MKQYYIRKVAIFLGTLLILIPSVLLLAWEDSIPNIAFMWLLLTLCSGMFVFAMYKGEKSRSETMTVKLFISKCGGFCIMFCFVAYKLLTCFA